MNGKTLKKWFMLQMWRLQQVASILTLVLLALNLSLQLFAFVRWRGEILSNPYLTVPMIALILFAIIWAFSIFWDLRLKMWRDQATVLIERNPYAKEKMYSKEIALYELMYLPILEELGKTSEKARKGAEAMRIWLHKAAIEDPATVKDLKEIFEYVDIKDREVPGERKRNT